MDNDKMKSTEFITEDDSLLARLFRDTFVQSDMTLSNIKIEEHDDNWVKVTAKGTEHFRAGTPAKIQYVISAWWDPESDEVAGTAKSQGSSYDKKYSKELDLEYDQFTLGEFANRINTFVTDIAIAQTTANAEGEKEYWKQGGRGMMPGAVHRK